MHAVGAGTLVGQVLSMGLFCYFAILLFCYFDIMLFCYFPLGLYATLGRIYMSLEAYIGTLSVVLIFLLLPIYSHGSLGRVLWPI